MIGGDRGLQRSQGRQSQGAHSKRSAAATTKNTDLAEPAWVVKSSTRATTTFLTNAKPTTNNQPWVLGWWQDDGRRVFSPRTSKTGIPNVYL